MEKNAILICINEENPENKIKIIQPDVVQGGKANIEYPIVVIYDGTHYSSVYPATLKDKELTKKLMNELTNFVGSNFQEHFKQVIKEDVFELHSSLIVEYVQNVKSNVRNPNDTFIDPDFSPFKRIFTQ